jgi:hypothetical protein
MSTATATATAEAPASKRRRKTEEMPPEPLACQPVGDLALSKIEDFPSSVADMLERLGLGTLTALEDRVAKASESHEGLSMESLIHDTIHSITGMGSYLCQTAAAAVVRHLNIGIEQVADEEPEAEAEAHASEPESTPETAEATAIPPNDPPTDTATATQPEGEEPWIDGGGRIAKEPPVEKIHEKSHATAEMLALYDAETVRLITELEQIVAEKLGTYKTLQKQSKDAKDVWEEETLALHAMIRSRAENRGRKPTPTLFDGIGQEPAIEADGWRALPLSAAHLTVAQIQACETEEVETLGDLSEWLQDDGDRDMKDELEAAIKRWDRARQRPEPVQAAPDVLEELWREFPIAGWKEYGLSDTDVKKLAEGHVKRDNSTFPIRTVGDLNRFVTPNPEMPDFVRGYGDIKGIGQAGVDRISEAETKFWASWQNGLKERFAEERGLVTKEPDSGDEAASGDCGEVPGPVEAEPVETVAE